MKTLNEYICTIFRTMKDMDILIACLIQVSGNCQYLPTYIPIAQFHRGAVTDKTGIFVSCQQGNDFVVI